MGGTPSDATCLLTFRFPSPRFSRASSPGPRKKRLKRDEVTRETTATKRTKRCSAETARDDRTLEKRLLGEGVEVPQRGWKTTRSGQPRVNTKRRTKGFSSAISPSISFALRRENKTRGNEAGRRAHRRLTASPRQAAWVHTLFLARLGAPVTGRTVPCGARRQTSIDLVNRHLGQG